VTRQVARWHARHAWLPDGLADDVLLEAVEGRWSRVEAGVPAPTETQRLDGVVVPGLADGHSHAFHRGLRGRTHGGGGTFWTWRRHAYALAEALDPDRYLALARAVYAEAALAGTTTVGEFHYLHHGAGGRPYADPNAMAEALRHAARDAGVRLTLLDACYLSGGLDATGHQPLTGAQLRFADADVEVWAERVQALQPDVRTRVGAAVHSVRAVPAEHLAAVASLAPLTSAGVLHAHVAEQPAEVEACVAVHGVTPVRLLAEHGVLRPRSVAVHATHLDDDDVARLGSTATGVCLCPTTERDLADGLGHAGLLAAAGVRLGVGSDQHVASGLLGEVRAVEEHERLRTGRRGAFTPAELLDMATAHDLVGWPDAGTLRVGARADLVEVRRDSLRTTGAVAEQVPLVAGTDDVRTVVVDGTAVVTGGIHVRLGGADDVARLLGSALGALEEVA
jgi:formiminoglutamate deiminase